MLGPALGLTWDFTPFVCKQKWLHKAQATGMRQEAREAY
jgi:hypothetical protein